jgi:5-methylthioadenosine/S-adenosylhomocysteine deaminase
VATLIRGASILTMAPADVAEPRIGDIRFDETGILTIGGEVQREPGDTVIDGSERLVMPGLVNAHTHSFEMPYRGRYERLPMELWAMLGFPTLGATPLPTRFIYLRTMVTALEALKGGVTTVLDDVDEWDGQTLESLAPIFAAYEEVGIRASVSGNFQNLADVDVMPFAEQVLPFRLRRRLAGGPPRSDEHYLAFLSEAIERFHRPEGRLQFVIAPCGPQWVSPALLRAAAALARAHGTNLHLHALETKLQVLTGERFFGRSLIQVMADADALGPLTTIAHGIWLTDQDIEMIAAAGASVVHNPISNLKLGAGLAPLRKLLDAGVNVGLGTDGPSCNDTVRISDTMRVAALIHTIAEPEPSRWPSAREIVAAATVGGARAANVDRHTGWLEPGRQADVLVLDLRELAFTPLNDVHKHLVATDVTQALAQVYVGGRLVVDSGTVLTVDEAAILDEFRAQLPGFRRMHAALEAQYDDFMPCLAEIHRRCTAEDVGIDRYASSAWRTVG